MELAVEVRNVYRFKTARPRVLERYAIEANVTNDDLVIMLFVYVLKLDISSYASVCDGGCCCTVQVVVVGCVKVKVV